jgi:hypothetical protein
MGKINWGRVVMGGLLAGVVLNVWDFLVNGVFLKNDWNAAMQALGKGEVTMSMIVWFVICDFITGVFLVWLYAAIRPRYGAGPKTAVCAGIGAWVLMLAFQVANAGMGLFPSNLLVITAIAALIGVPLSALAGAFFYKEEMGA